MFIDEIEKAIFQRLFFVFKAQGEVTTLLFDLEEPLLELFLFREVVRGIPWYTLLQLHQIGIDTAFNPQQSQQLSIMELSLPAHLIDRQCYLAPYCGGDGCLPLLAGRVGGQLLRSLL